MFAVLTNDPNAIFQRAVIHGVEAIATQHRYSTGVYSAEEAAALSVEVKGVLVIANILSNDALLEIKKRGIAVSLISHQHPALPSVVPNNRQGMMMLMEHLVIGCGRRKPLFIRGNMEQYDGQAREAAFDQEVMRYNLHEVHRIEGRFSTIVATQEMEAFLQHPPDFDCVLGGDHLMALAALEVLRQRGYRVPEDIAVAGFGDGTEAAEGGLTTVAADVVELGRRGARQLLHQLEGLHIRGQTLLSTTLKVRETTGKASRV